MKLTRFLLRYYPPGITLEFVVKTTQETRQKTIDLFDLTPDANVDVLAHRIVDQEPLVSAKRLPQLKALLKKLQGKLAVDAGKQYSLFRTLDAHHMPLTNLGFNKDGSKFITGSYDRTCRVWDTATGQELHKLEGHRNVVFALAFNNPFGDKIVTGSFDKTCKVWDATTGDCLHTLRGHTCEIISCGFDPTSTLIATGSIDNTARLWDVETGQSLASLEVHTGEIASLDFCMSSNLLVTASFDETACIWDTRSGLLVRRLEGHVEELSKAEFNFKGDVCVTGSLDSTVRLWDVGSGRCIKSLQDHQDEVVDVAFNKTGTKLVSGSGDKTAILWDVQTAELEAVLRGHTGEVSRVCFNTLGTAILTGSSDASAMLWDVSTGKCLQTLQGHKDEVFSCLFNYYGDTIITGSRDNTCRIWKWADGTDAAHLAGSTGKQSSNSRMGSAPATESKELDLMVSGHSVHMGSNSAAAAAAPERKPMAVLGASALQQGTFGYAGFENVEAEAYDDDDDDDDLGGEDYSAYAGDGDGMYGGVGDELVDENDAFGIVAAGVRGIPRRQQDEFKGRRRGNADPTEDTSHQNQLSRHESSGDGADAQEDDDDAGGLTNLVGLTGLRFGSGGSKEPPGYIS